MDKKQTDPALWVFLLYFAAFCIFYYLSPSIVGALIFGLYLSMIIMVPAGLISRIRFIGRKASVIISSLLVFAVLAYTILQIFPIVIDEAQKMLGNISVGSIDLKLPEFISNSEFSDEIQSAVYSAAEKILSVVSSAGFSIINGALQRIPNALTSSVVFIVAAAYFTSLIPLVRKNIWRFFPASTRGKSVAFTRDIYNSVKSFISGQLIIAASVGVVVGIGMMIAGIPYALFLGFLSCITNFIPYVGIIVTAVPAIFLGLSHYGWLGLVKVGIVLVIGNQLEVWILSPRIQGNRMELHWFVILIGIMLLGGLFGLVGVLFAIPIMVFFKKFWMEYVQEAFSRM